MHTLGRLELPRRKRGRWVVPLLLRPTHHRRRSSPAANRTTPPSSSVSYSATSFSLPQPLHFGTVPLAALLPWSHLPHFPTRPQPACVAEQASQDAESSKPSNVSTGFAASARSSSSRGGRPPSTRCVQLHERCSTKGLNRGSSNDVTTATNFADHPGTQFQTRILENYYCPIVRPLATSIPPVDLGLSQTNGSSPCLSFLRCP